MSTLDSGVSSISPVICIGELLWDIFPDGKRLLGGAIANVAYHLRHLRVDARLITRVGPDEPGNAAAAELARRDIRCADLQVDPVLPTGSASIHIDAHGEVTYEFSTPAAWDAIELCAVPSRSIIVFGTLAQRDSRSRSTVRALAEKAVVRIYDVNMRSRYTPMDTILESLRMATIVKMNEDEAIAIARHLGIVYDPFVFAQHVIQRYEIAAICGTRADRGAWLMTADGGWNDVRGIAIPVADPVGAGDAFLAALIASHVSGEPWRTALDKANRLGAWVASQRGPMPRYAADAQGLGN